MEKFKEVIERPLNLSTEKPKKGKEYYTVQLPKDLPFDLKIEKEKKIEITIPKWSELLKVGKNHLPSAFNFFTKKKDDQTDQIILEIIKENLKETPINKDSNIDLKDVLDEYREEKIDFGQ